jgi:hypothetical protein
MTPHRRYPSRHKLGEKGSNLCRLGQYHFRLEIPPALAMLMGMTSEELYQKRHEAVALVEALGTYEAVHKQLGDPLQVLPIGDFFVTNPDDRSVTYCDLVELYHFHGCAIRVGYINRLVKKVRGMPLEHWKSPGKGGH